MVKRSNMSACKSPAKSGATTVHHGPSPKAKYNLPPVEKQVGGIVSVSNGSPIKKRQNEETITLHHVVTDHGILTLHNRNGDSGLINNTVMLAWEMHMSRKN